MILLLLFLTNFTGGQTCFTNPKVNQRGEVSVSSGKQVIVPSSRFNCNGRITDVAVSMSTWHGDGYPQFQVWHPTSLNSSTYSKIGEVQLPGGDFVGVGQGRNYHYASLSLKKTSQIEFQSGDVIGYYQPFNPRRLLWSIQTSQCISYSNNITSPSTVIDTNNVDNIEANRQPLIEIKFGKIIRTINLHVQLYDSIIQLIKLAICR